MSIRGWTFGWLIASGALALGCSERDDGTLPPDDAGTPRMDAAATDASRPPDDGGVGVDAPSARDAGPPSDAGPAMTRLFVLNVLDVGQADPTGDPNVVPGFDIDMHVTTSTSDPMGCGFVDFVSGPPDDVMGVDNQLGPILAGVAGTIDFTAAMRDSIAAGDLILLIEVTDIHSFTDDPAVTVNIYRGVLPAGVVAPTLGTDMLLAPGQRFDIDARSVRPDGTALASAPGSIVGGRLRAGPTRVALDFGLMGFTFPLDIMNVQLRFDITPGMRIDTGILGGSAEVDELVASVALINPSLESTIRTILTSQADLAPDTSGACQSISAGLIFEGVTAMRGAVVTP